MYKGQNELMATAHDIALLASEAPQQGIPGMKAMATVALSSTAVMTAMSASPASASERIIASGDTLSEIAAETGLSVTDLALHNSIHNADVIYAGATLEIPDTDEPLHLAVEAGESPWSVARDLLGVEASQTTVKHLADKIISQNNIEVVGRRARLAIGTVLTIPDYNQHVIKPGETTSYVARELQVDISDIRSNSGTELEDPDYIQAGDYFIVPAKRKKSIQPEILVQPKALKIETPVSRIAPESKPTVEAVIPQPAAASPETPQVVLNFDAITEKKGVDAQKVRDVIRYMIDRHGLTPKAAAYMTGNFIQESSLNPSVAPGDNGTAHGLIQWRFERVEGMPKDDLYGQIDFALTVEMPRHYNGKDLVPLLRDPNVSDETLQREFKDWILWGHEGERFEYAQQILNELHAPASAPEITETSSVEVEKEINQPEIAVDPFDHPLIEKASRRQAPGRNGETIDIIRVDGEYVNVTIAVNTAKLLAAARNDGFDIRLTSAWRDIKEQEQLRIDNGCPDIYQSRASTCRVPTAIPGTSMHNGGEAIDVNTAGERLTHESFDWLQAHAAEYGFKNLPSEPWHWSTNGK